MNPKTRQAIHAAASKGCSVCGKTATVAVIWTFVDTARPRSGDDEPLLLFICCDDHVDEARAQKPDAPPHIRVDITEETFKPLVFRS